MNEHENHVVSRKVYVGVFAALLVLTFLTVAASFMDLGYWNTPVALLIACIKASLVVLFFMHVFYHRGFSWVIVGASVAWLGLMLAGTVTDNMTRLDERGARRQYDRRAPAHEQVTVEPQKQP